MYVSVIAPQGVVYSRGTNIRIGQVAVYNTRTKATVKTDNMGLFTILALIGDTLQFDHSNFLGQVYIVSDFKIILLHLAATNKLAEVVVYGQSIKNELKEVEEMYKSKGMFYKGNPPLYLLLPIDGKPLTFLYERFGKEGKQARKFNQFAKSEIEHSEVANRFNETIIKSIINIADNELVEFKAAYSPTSAQLGIWTDFDLYNYIKESYSEFNKGVHPKD